MTLYCCYYIPGRNNIRPVAVSYATLAIFMPITGLSDTKTPPSCSFLKIITSMMNFTIIIST